MRKINDYMIEYIDYDGSTQKTVVLAKSKAKAIELFEEDYGLIDISSTYQISYQPNPNKDLITFSEFRILDAFNIRDVYVSVGSGCNYSVNQVAIVEYCQYLKIIGFENEAIEKISDLIEAADSIDNLNKHIDELI